MAYGYAETFLVIFLTHPGVIIPTIQMVVKKFAKYIPPQIADLLSGVIPPPVSALWQVLWVWILSLPGEKSPVFGWTMYAVYLVFLLIYMVYIARMRYSFGV